MKKIFYLITVLTIETLSQSPAFYPVEHWRVSEYGMAINIETHDEFDSQGDTSQDWMPLAIGNKWRYIVTTTVNPTIDNPVNSVVTDSVYQKIIFNGLVYYKINSTIYRYDKDLEIFYYRANDDSDYVIIDFTKPPGYQYYLPPYYTCTIEQGNASLFDSLRFYKGYRDSWIYGHGKTRFSRNIGRFYSYSWADISGHPPIEVSSDLIEAILYDSAGITYYSYNNYPEIIITPILKISNPNFELNFSVEHTYTKNNFSFIDSVIMYSHYSKEDSIINNIPVLAINQPINSGNYTVSTVINMGLLLDGYTFNYRFTAKDKHLIPKYDFAPDSAYFIAVFDTLSDVKGEVEKSYINSYKLDQNYPNPFNPVTTINYDLVESGNVKLVVYDIHGREVAMLVNAQQQPGTYEVSWDASKFASGIYFYTLTSGDFTATKKLILLK